MKHFYTYSFTQVPFLLFQWISSQKLDIIVPNLSKVISSYFLASLSSYRQNLTQFFSNYGSQTTLGNAWRKTRLLNWLLLFHSGPLPTQSLTLYLLTISRTCYIFQLQAEPSSDTVKEDGSVYIWYIIGIIGYMVSEAFYFKGFILF